MASKARGSTKKFPLRGSLAGVDHCGSLNKGLIQPDYTSEQDNNRKLRGSLNGRDVGSARAKIKDRIKGQVSRVTWLGHAAL